MKKTLLILTLLLTPTIAHAQCAYIQHAPSLVVNPTAAAIETETTGQTEQNYILDLDNQDELIGPQCQANCASFARQFCFRQETYTDISAPGVVDRHITVSPSGFTCVTLKPPGCGTSFATILVNVKQDQGGTTPPHRYQYKTTVRATTNGSDPILAQTAYAYNRHDYLGNTCQYQPTP